LSHGADPRTARLYSRGMRVVGLDDIEGIPLFDKGLVWKPLRHELGIEAFGINAFAAASPGDEVVEDHDELGSGAGHQHELYVVVTGRATFTIDGDEVDAPAGTCVSLDDPATRRHAIAAEPATTVLAIGGVPGAAFRVSPWEFTFRAGEAARLGRRDEARAILHDGLERSPGNASLLYNLACYESLDGDRAAAIEHLTSAIAADQRFQAEASSDRDFDPIRDDPAFPADG
jgi:tetratricopeptide (TPR) repeat protein